MQSNDNRRAGLGVVEENGPKDHYSDFVKITKVEGNRDGWGELLDGEEDFEKEGLVRVVEKSVLDVVNVDSDLHEFLEGS